MNLELIKPMGKMQVGETFYARTQEQADELVDKGFAKHIADEPVVEKKLVLINPEPGVYTTVWQSVASKEGDTNIATSDTKGNTVNTPVITAKELIEKINAAATVEAANALVSADETRSTVKDALSKRISDLTK